MNLRKIILYDTTLRDGLGMEGISLSLKDKITIVRKLDGLGVHFIEGGYPGSNPKDASFFQSVKKLKLKNSEIVAFGSTRKINSKAENDISLKALLDAKTTYITIVGKSSFSQVQDVLQTTGEENISMIKDSIKFLLSKKRKVIFDAEHFFDGYKENEDYAISTIKAAAEAGAETVVLCDTNGGNLTSEIQQIVKKIAEMNITEIGIHVHNDADMAVANTIAAIEQGATHVQACLNGWGERTGNANIISIIANIKLKLKIDIVTDEQLAQLTKLSHFADELANLIPNDKQPYVGKSAFAHKAGLHVAAITKSSGTYTHINPELVGNQERILVSELSGRRNVEQKIKEQNIKISLSTDEVSKILKKIKEQEALGLQYESANASFELIVKKIKQDYQAPFYVEDFLVIERKQHVNHIDSAIISDAMVKVKVKNETFQSAENGSGPVAALDSALKNALTNFYPNLSIIKLIDYKVRIYNPTEGSAAGVRVFIESTDGKHSWKTVGASTDVIEASFKALQDAYEYWLIKQN
ncbi:MAG: 2-isopropylmalate synthase [Chloroflexi bacterium]|jgi:2-isopropylmalate synthase|nr:MAG: 2-isopropylmalate synthase [Chloroflexota bacterium]|tara:strand:+ start:769 stop:2349 length:1581 start_codon:yes stop_codon:yes gene_type:complete